MMIHSYHLDVPWTHSITQGVVEGLNKKKFQRNIDYILIEETLDMFNKSPEESVEQRAKLILNRIEQTRPDLIITTDDDALALVGLHIDHIPVVFNGINKNINHYTQHKRIDSTNKPNHNITGIYQTTYIKQTLTLLKQILPSVKNMAIFTDVSTMGQDVLALIKQTNDLPISVPFILQSNDYTKWQESFYNWQTKVDGFVIIAANSLVNQKGESVATKDAVEWLVANTDLPTVSFWDTTVSHGALLSSADTGYRQGWLTADYVFQILKGTNAGDLPIVTPRLGTPTINVSTLNKLALKLSPETARLFVFSGKAYQ